MFIIIKVREIQQYIGTNVLIKFNVNELTDDLGDIYIFTEIDNVVVNCHFY